MMSASCLRVTWLVCVLLVALGSELRAQGTETLYPARPEAWLMNYYTSATLFTGFEAPRSRPFGSVEVGIELDWLPALSVEDRTVGFNGTKLEDTNKCPVFFRPHVTVGLPWRFALAVSYLPPLEVCDVTAHLFAFALERPLYEHRLWRVGVRAYGQIGEITGDFTCPQDVTRFAPGSPGNLFGCEKTSSDTITLRYGGLELSGAYRIEQAAGLTPYLGVAVNYLDTQFQVDALTFGFADRRQLAAHTWTFSMRAGVTYPITERLHLSLGLFYSPLWVVRPPNTASQNDPLFNVRSLISYQFGPSPVPLSPGASRHQGG
jgi:hypothetical protein